VAKSRLDELTERGQSVWFDTLSRDLVHTGELKRMMEEDAVTGVTSNPTIFQKALTQGTSYDDQMKACLEETDDPREIFFRLALDDIRDACDVLRPAWEAAGGADGFVSMEVEPGIAYDTEASFDQAIWIHEQVERPNLLVKIPATRAGLPAIEDCIARGRSINITLIFSLDRYAAVVEAYLRGLERLVAGGGDPSKVASVASFFVSRVDTEADKRLEKIGGHEELRGKLAIANAKLAYQSYKEIFRGDDWEELKAAGASPQRCLWASTSTKNPDYRDVLYVEELIGPETVNTMPRETIEALQDHGQVQDTLERDVDEARRTLEAFAQAGVDYDDVVAVLEREGVEKFANSFKELFDGVDAKREELVAA
jgi:transaldolase